MAKKIDNVVKDIKNLIKDGKVYIGTKMTLKMLRQKKVSKVLVSGNCPDDVYADFAKISQLSGTMLEKLPYTNEELGVICKKPFLISVIGIKQ